MAIGTNDINRTRQFRLYVGHSRRAVWSAAAVTSDQATLDLSIDYRSTSIKVGGWLIGCLGPQVGLGGVDEIRCTRRLGDGGISGEALVPVIWKPHLRSALEGI